MAIFLGLVKIENALLGKLSDKLFDINLIFEIFLYISKNKYQIFVYDKNNLNNDLCVDVLLASVGFEITPVDKVVSRSKLPIEEVLTRLTLLELSGLVVGVPGGYLRLS